VTKQEESWLQGKCKGDFIQLLFVLREIYRGGIEKNFSIFFLQKKCSLNVFVEMHEWHLKFEKFFCTSFSC
jgi:hypothetical protein